MEKITVEMRYDIAILNEGLCRLTRFAREAILELRRAKTLDSEALFELAVELKNGRKDRQYRSEY